jgi:hypothetical protein
MSLLIIRTTIRKQKNERKRFKNFMTRVFLDLSFSIYF